MLNFRDSFARKYEPADKVDLRALRIMLDNAASKGELHFSFSEE